MPDNLTRQILSEHLADGELTPGEAISLRIDQTLLQDATGTMALMHLELLELHQGHGAGGVLEERLVDP
ncbi:MAG TPA: hypothetical protein VGW14_04150 [Thermoleophilaceae bacterium]|nr:hypothetical protein [Thermoleophilaceae bacterium]